MDLQKLREEEPKLAEELGNVSLRLDGGNFSDSVFINDVNNVGGHQHRVEDIVKEHRQLVGEWEELVDRVRQIPRFKYFLRPIPFGNLRQACMEGQVIIINVSAY